MRRRNPNWVPLTFSLLLTLSLLQPAFPQTADVAPMQDLKLSLDPVGWTGSDPCGWANVRCGSNRVTVIQLKNQGLKGNLPKSLSSLTGLEKLELQFNQITGPVPSLAGFSGLKSLYLNNNNLSAVPSDFFEGMKSLETVYMDYNPFSSWSLPDSLKSSDQLREFSANSANLVGKIPEFFGSFVGLTSLHLAMNSLEGGLPATFSGSSIQSLWVNGQKSASKLNGSVSVLQNMTQLTEVWLHGNQFSGPLPDFSGLMTLQHISFRDNLFTGPVPDSLIKLTSLKIVNLTNNLFQGPTPAFGPNVEAEITGINSFCLPQPGVECDSRVNTMLLIDKSFNYPQGFANDWQGNDPCSPKPWPGILCVDGKITLINFQKRRLTGTISPNFSNLESLEKLLLNNNGLTGKIPDDLTKLQNLSVLDVSNNQLYGEIPLFRNNVLLNTNGNNDIGKDTASPPPPGKSGGGSSEGDKSGSEKNGKSNIGLIIGAVVGVVCALSLIVLGVIFLHRGKRKRSARVQSPNTTVVHPRLSGSDQDVKITISNNNLGNNGTTSETLSLGSTAPSNAHVIEAGNMVITIQILRDVTNEFSENNILGRGGFGTVYKGELHDGTKIAVKRMESGVVSDKGLDEFKSEIAVLTQVRHKHLVNLLGYCLDGNERLLVYEYMPQGTLSRYLFDWKREGLRPLEWSKRLTIALDVARGVEYLHGLAQTSFIHRDLKPTNILLGDDLRAKVADFGLVRLAPDGKFSVVTKLAGTFGYLAPEYAVTGRVTTKIDVFSFGVILMELITGRKALDETQPEDSVHLVTWFRRMHLTDPESFLRKTADPTIDLSDAATLASVATVSELAGHCSAREPSRRPDMGHAVNVLSSLAEMWRPAEAEADDALGIDFDMTLPQALKKWQALENDDATTSTSSYLASGDNTQTSLPNRPSGFAASFTSADGR